MSREMKFRAWHKEACVMLYQKETNLGSWFDHEAYPQGAFIYEQVTGQTDKNDVEPYENDIVECIKTDRYEACFCVIEYQAEFGKYVGVRCGYAQDIGMKWLSSFGEKVGNVHENEELAK